MRRRVWSLVAGGLFLLQGGFVMAQNTLDTLDEELKEAQQHHDEVTSATLDNYFGQIDAAMASSDAAVALYQKAGGTMPPPALVITTHTDETVTEKAARDAIDQSNLTRLAVALQLHCGLLHYGALFVVKPDQKGLHDDFTNWLKTAASIYPQLAVAPSAPDANPNPTPNPGHHHRDQNGGNGGGGGSGQPQAYSPSDVKAKSLHESIISKFLAFNVWGDKEQGKWSVQDIPKLYRSNVLDPSRNPPTTDTLANWDAYIAMMNADTTDNDQWSEVVYPPLQFDRACDAYTIAPDTEKLEGLVNLIKANPTFPDVAGWIDRVKTMMAAYRAAHGGGGVVATPAPTAAPAPAPNASPTNPNVSVTTQQQGDMTIVTTHTNSAPTNPPSPQ